MSAHEEIVSAAASTVDRHLAETAAKLDFLLAVTPVNVAEAFESFRESGWRNEPAFVYRPPQVGDQMIEDLAELPTRDIEDAVLRELFHGKREELITQIGMVRAIDTPQFRELSLGLYGGVDDELLDSAHALIDGIKLDSPSVSAVTPEELAVRAKAELDAYRSNHPEVTATVEIRDDVVDLMVLRGNLLIGESSRFRAERVEPLIQHEIGTHVVTFFNGCAQPFHTLRLGLAGYEETQEGIALLSEHFVDGLDPERLRVLAARVIAVRRLLDGFSFVEIFGELRERGLSERSAWSVSSRVARSGGFTKDAIYLRGLLGVVRYLREEGTMEPLLVGKISLDHVPAIQELLDRGVLVPPQITPRWLERDDIHSRFDHIRRMEGPLALLETVVAA